MRAKTLVLGTALALMVAQAEPAAGTNADARFKAVYTKEWAWRQEQYAARDESDKRQPIVDHLPKMDPAAEASRLQHWMEVLKEVDAIPRGALSTNEQIDYDVYRPQLSALIASE